MTLLSSVIICLVAIQHVYFLILEMFFWTKPKGMKAFGLKSKQYAEDTKTLAANQGLYNGFLAAGLFFSVIQKNIYTSLFFLICIIIAGIYGAYSTKQIKLLYIQSLPAFIGLISIIVNII